MKRALTLAAAVAVVAVGGASIWAFAGGRVAGLSSESAVDAQPSGKLLGNFDLAMAGCQFACATQIEYDAKSVVAQPGAEEGKLTQCPVSGVVFGVDAARPHVRVGADDYVTCCDTCAEKLREDPPRFVRV